MCRTQYMHDVWDWSFILRVEFIQPSTFIRMSHTFLGQLIPHLTRILIPCDTFHTWVKQTDTFAEQRRHFISGSSIRVHLRSEFNRRCPFSFPHPPVRSCYFCPSFFYFFFDDRLGHRNDRLTSMKILFSFFPPRFLSSSSTALNDPRMDLCRVSVYTFHLSCQHSYPSIEASICIRVRISVSASLAPLFFIFHLFPFKWQLFTCVSNWLIFIIDVTSNF